MTRVRLVTRVPCPARTNTTDWCPVYGGRPACDHDHDAEWLAAGVKRTEAIDVACKNFAFIRDQLAKKHDSQAFREAIGPHEVKLDRAKDAAWAEWHEFRKAHGEYEPVTAAKVDQGVGE